MIELNSCSVLTMIIWKCLFFFPVLVWRVSTQRTCPLHHKLSRDDYRCDLKITGDVLDLFCVGNRTNRSMYTISQTNEFYVFLILASFPQHFIPINATLSLLTLLNSTTFKDESNFYACNSQLQSYINREIAQTSQHCVTNHDCLRFKSVFPLDNTVKSVQISDQPYFQLNEITLSAFNELETFILTRNKILLINGNIFQDLRSTRTMRLVNNSLTILPENLFRGMTDLENLDLAYNMLKSISVKHLAPLSRITDLNLSHNNLSHLDAKTFAQNLDIDHLNLSYNALNNLPQDIFVNLTKLNAMDLSGNELGDLPETIFTAQNKLKRINLSHCKLSELDEYIFQNTTNLIRIDLSHNEIKSFPENVFTQQPNLQYLDLSHNKIVWLSNHVLSGKEQLKTLLLNNNEITSLPRYALAHSKGLKTLDLSSNRLEMLDNSYVEPFEDLNLLDLSRNRIRNLELGEYREVKVRNIFLSHNNIVNCELPWAQMDFLEKIDFDFNELTELELPPCSSSMKTKIEFSYRNNNISKIVINPNFTYGYRCLVGGVPKTTVLLDGNSIDCDCNLYPFYEQVVGRLPKTELVFSFPDGNILTCENPSNLFGQKIALLPKDVFTCPIEMDCPLSCHCYVRGYDGRIVTNCSSSRWRTLPSPTPKNTTVLYFQNNTLSKTSGFSSKLWENLAELYLDDNLLQSIDTSLPESLIFLSVTQNRMKGLPETLKRFISEHRNFRMKISGNKWSCACESTELKSWLLKNKERVLDIDNVTCVVKEYNATRRIPLYRIPDSYLCAASSSTQDHFAITIAVVVGSILIIIVLILSLMYYKNRDLVLAFLFDTALFRCCFEGEYPDEEKRFDAFVAYSSQDREVVMELVKGLEQSEPYFKLCIHERDWMPGIYISENIVHSVQNSRRTVIVLSENFVSSMWFAIEIRAALFQMLEDRTNLLLVVVIGEFPPSDSMDEDVRQLLLRKTYLTWGERWFWEKIRYSMPHKANLEKGLSFIRRRRRSNLIKMVENDINTAMISAAEEEHSE